MTYSDFIKPGVLEVYCGPMKSGKSNSLLQRIDKLNFTDSSFVLFKPKLDNRDPVAFSRSNSNYCSFVSIDETNPLSIVDYVKKEHSLIAIDEVQFFNVGIERIIKHLLLKDKNVVVAGLDLDFRGKPFGMMPYLLSMANEVTKLTAVCEYKNCNLAASRTQRLIDNKPAKYDSPVILVGDKKEGYSPRCLKHHEIDRD